MVNFMQTPIFSTTLLGWLLLAAAQTNTLNDEVVKFCKQNIGQKVGEGQCAHLAWKAFEQIGAKTPNKFKDAPNPGDYVWGDLVYALEAKNNSLKETKVPGMTMKPGDVIQLSGVTFKGKNLRGYPNYSVSYPHHTSVLAGVKKDLITVYEQNVGGKMTVTENPIRLGDLQTGYLRVYRPVAK